MSDRRHRQAVEKTLKDSVKIDKAKVELSRISKFGLLEMSRQRLKTSIASQRYASCPYCIGRGRVKTSEAAALEALRKIESAVYAGDVEEIRIRLNPTAALFLLNEKRRALSSLEDETNVNIKVIADGRMRQHEYDLELVNSRSGSSESSQDGEGDRKPSSRSTSSGRGRGRKSNQKRGRRDNKKPEGRRAASTKKEASEKAPEKAEKPKSAPRKPRKASSSDSEASSDKKPASADVPEKASGNATTTPSSA